MIGDEPAVMAQALQSKVQAWLRHVETAAAPDDGSHIASHSGGGVPAVTHR